MATVALTDKELTSVRALTKDTLKADVHVDILSIDKIFTLEKLKKNKENYSDRFLVLVSEPGRILIIKSKFTGKSISENILILTVNEIKYYTHKNKENTLFYCIELIYNDRTKSIIICSSNSDLINKILISLLSIIYMISQCAMFEPKLTDINKDTIISKIDRIKFKLTSAQILSLSYQILCIIENVIIDKNLYELFSDIKFHDTNHIFDINYILKHYTILAIKNGNKYKINLREVLVIIHALHYVDSFSHIHLDGITINEEIAVRLAKLIVRNENIQSIALRKTGINGKMFEVFNSVIDKEIIKNTKLTKRMKILDHLTLSHNNLQLSGDENKKKKKRGIGDGENTFFGCMDGNVLCVKKFYLSRCNLNRELLSEIIDAVINYKYLEKIDLSFNNLGSDSIITYKLSQFMKKVQNLQSLLLKGCQLQLNFLQDLLTNKTYNYRELLQFIDLSGNIMTHYGAIAIGQILQNTIVPAIKIDLSSIQNMDHVMLESILFGPFRGAFKNIYIEIILSNVNFGDNNEYLKALSNTIRFAQQQKNDCNGIQCMDLSRNNLGPVFDIVCQSYISNFYCLEAINLDFNFKLNKTKKGFYSDMIKALCIGIGKLNKLNSLSLRGDWANNLYLTYDDLLPLLQFLSEKECKLQCLYLDGNRIKDDGCKIIANSLKTNNTLQIISIEDNKCTFKGFLKIMQSISAQETNCKLIDVPLHSVLDDSNFTKKIKKNADIINKCIKIINENDMKQTEQEEKNEYEKYNPFDFGYGSDKYVKIVTKEQRPFDVFSFFGAEVFFLDVVKSDDGKNLDIKGYCVNEWRGDGEIVIEEQKKKRNAWDKVVAWQ
eukprot:118061_1